MPHPVELGVTYDDVLLRDGRLNGRPVDIRVRAGRIAEIVASGTAPSVSASGAAVLDLRGRTVWPGLRDAHTHLAWWAVERRRAPLNAALSAAPSASAAAEATARHLPSTGWVRGMGFHQSTWTDAPHRTLLDRAAPGRAVVLASHDAHSGWFSTAALQAIGSTHPTGFLREHEWWAALALVPEADAVEAAVDDALAHIAGLGITGVIDIDLGGDAWSSWRLRADRHAGVLPVRISSCILAPDLDEVLAEGRATGTPDGLLRAGRLKLFADGALGSRTALCHHPFDGDGDNHGQALATTEELTDLIVAASAGAIATTVHAIGDAAVRNALDAFAAAGVGGRIEHAQLVDPVDLPRFAALGVEVSIQPVHCPEDRDLSDRWWGSRTDHVYPYRALHDAGASIVLGSDAPVSELDPWRAIAAAITRTLDERPPWHPEQALTLDEAVAASTGTRVEVGAPADLVVVDDDPARIAAGDLSGALVAATFVAGRSSYLRTDLAV